MKTVLVIGDIIADVYDRCTLRKMCPDAPDVPALLRKSTETRAGGAANVAVNLCALDPTVRVSLIGEADTELCRIIKYQTRNRVEMSYVQMTDEVMLTKRRIFNGDQLVVRLDRSDYVGGYTQQQVFHLLKDYLANNNPDLILLSDYGHGTVGPDALQLLLRYKGILMVDTKKIDLSVFQGSLLCKLNQDEHDAVVTKQGDYAPERWFRYLVVTQGRAGAVLHMRREVSPGVSQTDTMKVKGHNVAAVDVCGCGDTFLAGLASSMLLNGDPFTATVFANAAAATVVTKKGTAVADRAEALKLSGLVEKTSEAG